MGDLSYFTQGHGTSGGVVPAREVASIMAGGKRGLEVLFAPASKQSDGVYTEEELFIG